jgi:hypothetical protein
LNADIYHHSIIVLEYSPPHPKYYILLKPFGDGSGWVKFFNENVMRVTSEEALHGYPGDNEESKRIPYILVYIRQSEVADLLGG